MMCTLVLQLQPGRRSFNHDGGGVDLSTKHKAVTVLTPLHSEYLLHVSSKRNFHELDNRLEAKVDYLHVSSNIRSDKGWWQRRWSRKFRQNADTSDNNYKDWMMMIQKKCWVLKLNPLAHFAIIALIWFLMPMFDDPTGGLKLDRHDLENFLQGETWHPWYLLWISEWLCKTLCVNFAQNFLQQAWEVKFQRKLDSWSRGILPWVQIFVSSSLSPLISIA